MSLIFSHRRSLCYSPVFPGRYVPFCFQVSVILHVNQNFFCALFQKCSYMKIFTFIVSEFVNLITSAFFYVILHICLPIIVMDTYCLCVLRYVLTQETVKQATSIQKRQSEQQHYSTHQSCNISLGFSYHHWVFICFPTKVFPYCYLQNPEIA